MEKIACITGASSGIGRETALILAENGYKLILCGRRIDRLEALQKEILVDSTILIFDVRDLGQVQSSFATLSEDWKNIDVLINNAGNAHGLSPIQDGDIADWDAMMHGNVNGLLYVSKAVIPWMIARKKGHIINISSIAGKQIYANGAVYCASKAAVEVLSQGMRIDLNPFGIKVSNLAPGAVNTEFSAVRFKGNVEKVDAVYKGFEPLLAKDVAEVLRFMVMAPAHVNLSDVTLLPTAQASANLINRV
jgi:NADP-dependent 3-hydroxy acid dehydrogenase YdfG